MVINFVKRGKGKKTIVFLHGWGGSWQSWAPIIERLESKFTIYALDLPGFGLSPLSRPYNLTDYVTDITNFFQKNNIVRPILIGHSFGGQIAAEFAIEKSGLLLNLVLVDAAVFRRNDLIIKLNILIAKSGQIFHKNLYPILRKWYYRLRRIENSDYFKLIDNPNLQSTASNIFRQDLTEDLVKIKTSTLIFWGENDPPELTPVDQAKKIHQKIVGSKLVIIPNVGHFSYLDAQEKFCEELLKL